MDRIEAIRKRNKEWFKQIERIEAKGDIDFLLSEIDSLKAKRTQKSPKILVKALIKQFKREEVGSK